MCFRGTWYRVVYSWSNLSGSVSPLADWKLVAFYFLWLRWICQNQLPFFIQLQFPLTETPAKRTEGPDSCVISWFWVFMELEFPSGHFPRGLKFLPWFQATELIFPLHFLVLWKGIALLPISGFPESLAFTNSVSWPLSPLSLRHITAVMLLSVSRLWNRQGDTYG